MKKLLLLIFLFLPHNIAYNAIFYKNSTIAWYEYIKSNIVAEIKFYEGFSKVPYKDSKGINTIGYGLTGSGLDSITEKHADSMIIVKLNEFESYSKKKFSFDNKVKHLAIAYISYCFGFKRIINEKFVKNNQLDSSLFVKFCYHNGKFNKRMYTQRIKQIRYFYEKRN